MIKRPPLRDVILKPNMIRCLVILPFNLLCHKCRTETCEEKLHPISIKLNGCLLIIHPPIQVGENVWANLPRGKWKDLGLNLTHESYNPEAYLPRPTAELSDDETEYCNGILIDVPNRTDSKSFDKLIDDIVSNLCNLIRLNTKQYWIVPNLYMDQIIGLRYQAILLGGLKQLEIRTSNLKVYPSLIEYSVLNMDLFYTSVNQLKSYHFDFEKHKFLDGIRDFGVEQKMNALVNISISAEIAKNRLLDRIWAVEQPFKKVVDSNYKAIGFIGNNLKEHISKFLKKSRVAKSFKDDNPSEYSEISMMWKYRCQAGHGYESFCNAQGKPIEIKKETFTKMAKATQVLREYCYSIKVPH